MRDSIPSARVPESKSGKMSFWDVLAMKVHELGVAALSQCEFRRAEAGFKLALRMNPQDVDAMMNLGHTYFLTRRQEASLDTFESLIALKDKIPVPKDLLAMAHVNLARCYISLRDSRRAYEILKQAIELDPNLPEALLTLGYVYHLWNRTDEARYWIQRVLELDPGSVDAHLAVGEIESDAGQRARAVSWLERARDLRPDWSEPYALLAEMNYYKDIKYPDIQYIWRLLRTKKSIPRYLMSPFYYVLARVYDGLGHWDEAFSLMKNYNDIQYSSIPGRFSEGVLRRDVNRLISTFDKTTFRRLRGMAPAEKNEKLIFIVGMPRSGTTLVEQVLAGHPSVFAGGERRELIQLVKNLNAEIGCDMRYPQSVRALDAPALGRISARHLSLIEELSAGYTRFTDKLPFNFWHIGLIKILFPGARIIHCTRNPLDVIVSCYFQRFDRVGFANRLQDITRAYRQYGRIMRHWYDLLGGEIHEVNYETLIAEQEKTTRSLLEYCGLPWQETCLHFYRSSRVTDTCSRWQVKSPIYSSSVGRWRNYQQHLKGARRILGRLEEPGSLSVLCDIHT
ncbi:MAG: tetratricopeptide repeat-containing sulfotransferase family protein [Isosphaeraceae bacterium]